MEVVLQKTHSMGLIALSPDDYEKLPQNFLACIKEPKMSQKQRGSLHVWCGQVAKVLNDNGHFHEKIHPFTKKVMEVEWTKESVKEDLYKPTLKAFKGKLSTEEQNTVEPGEIAEALSRAYAKTFGLVLPFWPTKERALI